MRRRKPSEMTAREAQAEADALRDELEEADRLDAPLFYEEFYGITIEEARVEAEILRARLRKADRQDAWLLRLNLRELEREESDDSDSDPTAN